MLTVPRAETKNPWFRGYWFLGLELDSNTEDVAVTSTEAPREDTPLIEKNGTSMPLKTYDGVKIDSGADDSGGGGGGGDGDAPVDASLIESQAAPERPKPKYLQEQKVGIPRNEFTQWLLGEPANAHENLFWFDRMGPETIDWYVRICLILLAVFIPSVVLVMSYETDMVIRGEGSALTLLVRLVVTIGGWFSAYFTLIEVICDSGVVQSIEMMRKRDMVNKVKVDQLNKKVLKLFGVITKLRFVADLKRDTTGESAIRSVDLSKMDRQWKKHVEDVFVAYDVDFSGSLEAPELEKLLHSLGQEADTQKAQLLVKALSTDGDDAVSLEEFTAWMFLQEQGKSTSSDESLEDVAASIFTLFDTNGDGTLMLEELEEKIKAYGLSLAPEELSVLIKQLDTNLDGEVTVNEFAAMLEANGFEG